MWRRDDQVLPLEEAILKIARDFRRNSDGTGTTGEGWFHAYRLAELISEQHGTSLLANGTLYRALRGMALRDWLERRVETDEEANSHAGPPRRYYRIAPDGEIALARATGQSRSKKLAKKPIDVRTATPGP